MSHPDETQTITGWRTASRFYRRAPGLGWLLTALVIPLLLGLVGWGALGKSDKDADLAGPDNGSSVSAPAAGTANGTAPVLVAGLSILRNGNDITLSGDLPDLAAKNGLIDSLRGVFGPDVNLIDQLNVKTGVNAPDLNGIDPVFRAAIDIPDFNWKIDGQTVTLTGTAPSDEVKAAVESATKTAWPDATIDNQIRLAAETPAPPAGDCGSLQADVNALLQTPINFDSNGSTVAPSSTQALTEISDKVKACPDSRIAVNGYTDNSGTDAINIPLSATRAKAVADFLVSQGIAADHVTSQGFGSADPVAGNDTPEGKAQNRRVEITVS